jgi:hypothetical protein
MLDDENSIAAKHAHEESDEQVWGRQGRAAQENQRKYRHGS